MESKEQQCESCSFSTKHSSSLARHKRRSHSDSTPYSCDHCGKQFVYLSILKEHLNKSFCKINTQSFKCQQDKQTNSLEKVNDLSKPEKPQVSGNPSFECKVCFKNYSDASNLKRHYKTQLHTKTCENGPCLDSKKKEDLSKPKGQQHSRLLTFKCEDCNYVSNWKHALKRHRLKHVEENHGNIPSSKERFECTVCDYVSEQSDSLKQHLLIHTKNNLPKSSRILEKEYNCKFCDYSGEYPISLKKHLLTHSKEKLYQCDYCDHRSNYIRHLKIHILNHKGEKPYRCKYCLFQSADQNVIRGHIRKVHSNATLYSCEVCDFKSKYKQKIVHHIRRVHQEKKMSKYIESDFCNTIVKSPFSGHNEQNHSVKVYKCDKCAFETTKKDIFFTHSKSHFNSNRRQKFIDLCNAIGKMEPKTKNVPCLISQLEANLLLLRSHFPVTSGIDCQSYSDEIRLPSKLLDKGTEKTFKEEPNDSLKSNNE